MNAHLPCTASTRNAIVSTSFSFMHTAFMAAATTTAAAAKLFFCPSTGYTTIFVEIFAKRRRWSFAAMNGKMRRICITPLANKNTFLQFWFHKSYFMQSLITLEQFPTCHAYVSRFLVCIFHSHTLFSWFFLSPSRSLSVCVFYSLFSISILFSHLSPERLNSSETNQRKNE